jgi:hypothetical protein
VNPKDNGPWGISCVVQLDGLLLGGTTSSVGYVDGELKTSAYANTTFLVSYGQIEFSNYQPINVDVDPGDSVTCTVCAPSSTTSGYCYFSNQTKGQATWVSITQPPSLNVLTRTSAAWGVVVGAEDEHWFSTQAPYIGIVALTDCTAGSPTSSLGLEPGGVVSNLDASINNPEPNPVWETVVLSPSSGTSSAMWVIDYTK